MSIPPAVTALDMCWSSFDSLISALDADQMRTQSLCPAWKVRDVVVHIGAIEHMLSGSAPGSMTAIPFEKVGAWMSEVGSLDDADLLTRYREVIAARRAEVGSLTSSDLELASATPVGPGTYGKFMGIRVFDCWAHEQDVRVPLGLPGHQDGLAAEMAIDEIVRSLPYIVGKKVGLPDGMGITIELAGPVQRTMHVAVTGRAAVVDALESPDVVLTADSTTFALLACGRIDPQGPIDDGRIAWTGDATWGDKAARSLAFTM